MDTSTGLFAKRRNASCIRRTGYHRKPTTLSGPDEETEMNFMSAGQCPAVNATRTARWCQRRKVCFQVPMHFAADAIPACSVIHAFALFSSDRLLEKVARNCRKKFENTAFRFLVTILWLTCSHVSHNAPRQGVAGAALATLGCFGAAALQGSLATASGRRRARLQKYKTVEVPETWHTGRAQRGLHFDSF